MGAPKGNLNALFNTGGGSQPMYSSPDEFKEKAIEFFESFLHEDKKVDYLGDHPTITGLALYLGFADRQSLYDYQNREEFALVVRTARTLVEKNYEEALMSKSVTGAIFALKNMGWSDKKEVDHTSKGEKIGSSIQLPDGQDWKEFKEELKDLDG